MNSIYREIKKMLHDTLKRGDCYAWDKVTTFFSFQIIVVMAFIDFLTPFDIDFFSLHIKHFPVNEFVFGNFTVMALGSGAASLIKNKIAAVKENDNK